MNFQDMDALGGLLAGEKFAQDQQSTKIEQQNLLQQIANNQQKQGFDAEMQPLKMEGERALNADRASQTAHRDRQTADMQRKATREDASIFLENMIQAGNLPGAEAFWAGELGIPEGHPILNAYRKAKKYDQDYAGNWGPGEQPQMSKVQELQQALAASDSKSRQATATADASQRRLETQQAGLNTRQDRAHENARVLQEAKLQSQMAIAELNALSRTEAANKITGLNQYAATLQAQADKAQMEGRADEAAMLAKKAQEVVNTIKSIASNNDVGKKEAEAENLYVITDKKIDIRGNATKAAAAAAGKPAAAVPAAAEPVSVAPAAHEVPEDQKEYRVDPKTGNKQWRVKPQAVQATQSALRRTEPTAAGESSDTATPTSKKKTEDEWWMKLIRVPNYSTTGR